jgi:hypothetical protein
LEKLACKCGKLMVDLTELLKSKPNIPETLEVLVEELFT